MSKGKAFLTFLLILFGRVLLAEDISVRKILILEVHSVISPSTLNYMETGFQKAQREGADLILIKLSTPGGLVTTTKDILSLFGLSDIPIAVWVTPEGSSATSAGAILASAPHILVMSEGTNIGAATPIGMGGGIEDDDMRNKAVNDLVALVQSLAETRGRNAKMFGEMIRSASSFKAQEAHKEKLIDGIVNSEEEFYQFLRGHRIHIKGQDKTLTVPTMPPVVVHHEADFGQQFFSVFANPSLAYILLLIGAALIYLELQAPGGFVAGALGTISLILAAIGLQLLPSIFGGLGLIVLAFILFVVEAFVTSYGLLAFAGVASLISGSLLLYRTEDSYLSLSKTIIFSASGAIVAFLGLIIFIMIRERKKIGSITFNQLVGERATVVAIAGELGDGIHAYQVQVGSELWKATSEKVYRQGEHCVIKGRRELVLKI